MLRLQARIPQISAQILVARSCCGDPPYIDDLTVDGLNYEAGRVQAERQRIVAMTDEDIFDGILAEMADDLERMDPADASIDVWADDEGDIETGLPAVFEGNEIEGFLANPPSADELQPDDAAADPEGVDPGVVAQERARQRARRINGRREDLLQANSALSLRIDQELGARADYDRLEPELQEVMRGAVESGRLIEMHCPR
ncbi:MAG: hypothetical protein DHS20C06_00920 [Hyphobacterium sp.]|nr:MAG: hypothetical protein DHS20C06_00920 [Hyphobacterium sp.]